MSIDPILIYIGMKPTDFDFVVDNSLSQCSLLLKTLEYKPHLLNTSGQLHAIGVDYNQINESTHVFRILKKEPKGLPILITASMTQLSNESTQVTGTAQTQYLLRQLAIVTGPFLVLFVATLVFFEPHYPNNVIWGSIEVSVFVLFIAFIVIANALERRWLINRIRETLKSQS